MNLLLIHQSFVDPHHAGGTRHFELSSNLVRAGHAVTIVAGNVNYLTGQRFVDTWAPYAVQQLEGVRILRAYVYPALHRSFLWRIVSFLSFMFSSVYAGLRAGPVDVVMGTSPPIFQLFSAWLVAALRRRPLLLEIRDLWPEFAIDMGVLKNPLLIRIARWAEAFLYRRAAHLLVNSPAFRDYLVGRGVAAKRITVIPNGTDVRMFQPDDRGAILRQELGLTEHFVVTYAGALGLANDIPTVIQAADLLRDLPDIHILMVGDGKERPKLEQRVRELGLQNMTFAGVFPKSRMGEVLAASDACLAILQNIPMFSTTYPNKVFDYMAAGRPTVLAIDGVIREVVETAHGGVFVPPGNPRALADAILQLKSDPEMAHSMGRSARQYVETHFDRRDQAVQFEHLVCQVAHDAGQGPAPESPAEMQP